MSTIDRYVTRVWNEPEQEYCTPKWNYMIRYKADGSVVSLWRELKINKEGGVCIHTREAGIVRLPATKLDGWSETPELPTLNIWQRTNPVALEDDEGEYVFSEEESEHCEEEACEEEAREEEDHKEEDHKEEVKPKEEGMEASLTRLKIQVERLTELQTMYEGILKIQKAGQEYMEQVKRLKEENEILRKRNEELANIKIDEVKHFLKREEKLELQNRHLEYQLASLRREKGQENWQRRGGLKRTDGGFIPLQPAYNVWGRSGWKPPKAEVHMPTQNEAPKSEEPVEE